jgi:hypothetical protein
MQHVPILHGKRNENTPRVGSVVTWHLACLDGIITVGNAGDLEGR